MTFFASIASRPTPLISYIILILLLGGEPVQWRYFQIAPTKHCCFFNELFDFNSSKCLLCFFFFGKNNYYWNFA